LLLYAAEAAREASGQSYYFILVEPKIGKLYKILCLTNRMTEEALSTAIRTSLRDFLRTFLPYKIEENSKPNWNKPLFKIQLHLRSNYFVFEPELENFEKNITELVIKVVEWIQTIPTIELSIQERKYYAQLYTPVTVEDPLVQDVLQTIKGIV
jgi:hypothetical protein